MHYAVRAVDLRYRFVFEFLKLFLDHSANVNAQNSQGQTALHLIAEDSAAHPDIVKFLLLHGADPKLRDQDQRYPGDIALAVGNVELAKLLAVCE